MTDTVSKFYIVVDSGTTSNQSLFSDVRRLRNARQVSWVCLVSNPILRLLNRVHFSVKVNKMINLPLKGIWDGSYAIDQWTCDETAVYYLVVTNWSICKFSVSYLAKLNQRSNIRLVLLYLDPLAAVPSYYRNIIDKIQFDLTYTMDMADSKRYGWKYCTTLYSRLPIEAADEIYDIFYIGYDKGRGALLRDIHTRLARGGITCKFVVVSDSMAVSRKPNSTEGFTYINRKWPYARVLEYISKSKCILEVVQSGQTGLTMRPYEALFYNKKLLTNNPAILETPFYKPEYISVFSSAEDIDVGFLKDKGLVDYNYREEYSPIKFLESLE